MTKVGRPRLNISDEERKERHKASAKKSHEKLKLRHVTIDGDLLERFTRFERDKKQKNTSRVDEQTVF